MFTTASIVALTLAVSQAPADAPPASNSVAAPVAARSASFQPLEGFHGSWTGELDLGIVQGGVRQRVQMALEIEPSKDGVSMPWRIIYGTGETKQVRDYALRLGDRPGRYVIDEKNGILLDATYASGLLTSVFEVQGSLLVTTERLVGDELHFAIDTFAAEGTRVSKIGEGDGAVRVKSYLPQTSQRAILKKQPAADHQR